MKIYNSLRNALKMILVATSSMFMNLMSSAIRTEIHLTTVLILVFTISLNICFSQSDCSNNPSSSIIPNPSFENFSCGPTGITHFDNNNVLQDQMNCVNNWTQVSTIATADYFLNNGSFFPDYLPQPVPDGIACVGIRHGDGFMEYIGNVLTSPMMSGNTYTLQVDIASFLLSTFVSPNNTDMNAFLGANPCTNVQVGIYGAPDCNFPYATGGCPTNFGFNLLGQTNYTTSLQWNQLSINFTPTQNINCIIVGIVCNSGIGCNSPVDSSPFYLIDNLVLNQSQQLSGEMDANQTGDPCDNSLAVEISNPPVTSGNFTWYVNGSIIDAPDSPTFIPEPGTINAGDVISCQFVDAIDGWCANAFQTIVSPGLPSAQFSAEPVCHGDSTFLFDESEVMTGSISSWQWDFGDGIGTSDNQNPVHLFSEPGTYNISLTVTSDIGCSNTHVDEFVVHPNPTVAFEPHLVCVNIENEYEDLSVADGQTISEVIWDFGDGSAETSGLAVDHTFLNGGEYTVTQTVTTNLGCSTTEPQMVSVEEIPSVDFEWNDPCANQELALFINQTDSGDVPIDYYLWQFGDGESATGTNAEHLYTEPQLVEAWLYAHTQNGCVDSTMNMVTVKGVTAEIDFVNVCEDADAEMQNLSVAHNDDLGASSWDLGQGLTSIELEPTTTYDNFGEYEIQLIQYSASGCVDSTSQTIEIYQNPTASFVHVHDSCVFENFGFLGNSFVPENDELIGFDWQFGDGNTQNSGPDANHTYMQSGNMSVNYAVLSALGCVHDTTISIAVRPLPIPDFEVNPVCEYAGPSEFTYLPLATNAEITNHFWEFDDGNTSEEISPSNQYDQYGTYNVTLTITDQYNCVDNITKPAIVERVIAEFDAPVRNGCPPLEVELLNSSWSSHSQIVSYEWTTDPFSIPLVATSPVMELDNPSDTSNQFYDVQLVATSGYGCVDTAFTSEYIEVFYAPNAAFVLEYDNKQEVLNYIRTLNLTTSAVSYVWDLGNGIQSTNENMDWYYQEHGEYEVSLTAYSPNGCPRTVSELIYINPANQLYIPNAFTPNADGTNEKFGPVIYGDDIKRYEFVIFNRWGNKVFHTEDPETWWNGASKSEGDYYSQNEVYVYQIIVQFENDPVAQQHKGHVTLIR